MIKKIFVLSLLMIAYSSQSDAQSADNLKEINKVWAKFYKAFDSLDYKYMAEIHSKELIRIAGGQRISDYETYINSYKTRFKSAKENKVSNTISLRFFERVNNDSIASERGIYQLTRMVNNADAKKYYGQFHVLFKKDNGTWKILMDYDSDEANTIGEDDYLKAQGINEFEKFIKN